MFLKRFTVFLMLICLCLALPGITYADVGTLPDLITTNYTLSSSQQINKTITVAKDRTLSVASGVYATVYGDLNLYGNLVLGANSSLTVTGKVNIGKYANATKNQITEYITAKKLICSNVTVIDDKTYPMVLGFSPKPGQLVKGWTYITVKVVDYQSGMNYGGVVVKLDNKQLTHPRYASDGTIIFTPGTLTDGSHMVKAYLPDKAGNVRGMTWSFNVDNLGPKITAVTPISAKSLYRRPSIYARVAPTWDVNWATARAIWDGKLTTKPVVKKYNLTLTPSKALGNGLHTVTLYLTDKRGNRKSLTWKVNIYTPYIKSVPSGIWVEVNQKLQRIYVLKGNQIIREIICSTGKPSSPTPNGTFHIQNRGPWFTTKQKTAGAKYWVSFKGWGSYMFHSVIYNYRGTYIIRGEAAKLGRKASHGCIRMPLQEAKWFYGYVPGNSLVVIHEPK